MQPPHYWTQASRELARRDPVMRRLARRFRGQALQSRGDAFVTLARSIVGQQISVKAADTIWRRLVDAADEIAPAAMLGMAPERLAACGLSRRKVEYLLDLAARFDAGQLRVGEWQLLDDEEVIRALVKVRGIGRWTAEMFLIFNLLRPNVLPLDDIGLLRAAALLYFDGAMPDRKRMAKLGGTWSPWCSVATWYLWRSLDPVPVEY